MSDDIEDQPETPITPEEVNERGSTPVIETTDESPYVEEDKPVRPTEEEVVLDEPEGELEDVFADTAPVGLDEVKTSEKATERPERKQQQILDEYMSEGEDTGNPNALPIPSLTVDDLNTFINNNSDIAEEEVTPELRAWKEVADEAVELYPPLGMHQSSIYEQDREWVQGVHNKDKTDRASYSSVNFKPKPGEIKGEVALLKVARVLGLGDVIAVPLPHTGIWVTIKPPTEREMIQFYNGMFNKKQMLGRMTYGLSLTNLACYTNNDLFEFIVEHIHGINSTVITKANLAEHLNINDYLFLAWGFACSIYPSGYDYQRVCTSGLRKCTHIDKGRINLMKAAWIDNAALTDVQKVMLYDNRSTKLSLQHHEKYAIEHTRLNKKVVELGKGIKVHLRVPTFSEHISDGLAWANGVTDAVERALLDDYDGTEYTRADDMDSQTAYKQDMLNRYVSASVLREFSHYVEMIEVDDSQIKTREDINKVLESLSADDVIREQLTKEIVAYQVHTTIGLVGIPEYTCSVCKGEQNSSAKGTRWASIIPIDILGTVFLLLASKISKILNRTM